MPGRAKEKARGFKEACLDHGNGGNKLVMLDFGGYPSPAIDAGLYAHDFALAAYLYVAAGYIFRQSNHEVNRFAGLEFILGDKI
jgi:hypothetical protein